MAREEGEAEGREGSRTGEELGSSTSEGKGVRRGTEGSSTRELRRRGAAHIGREGVRMLGSNLVTRAAERWERWERVPSQFEILAAILADDLRTFVAK